MQVQHIGVEHRWKGVEGPATLNIHEAPDTLHKHEPLEALSCHDIFNWPATSGTSFGSFYPKS